MSKVKRGFLTAQGDWSPSSHPVQESAVESSENYLKKERREVYTIHRNFTKENQEHRMFR